MVTALGANVQQNWQRLLQGETGLQFRQPFPTLPVVPLGMVGKHPAQPLELLSAALNEAIADAGLNPPLPDCGIVIGSSRSFQGKLEQQAHTWLSQGKPPDGKQWLASLPSIPALWTAQQVGAKGFVLAPMAACATGLTALFQGYELIRTGQYERVIVGAVEAPITPLTLTGFRQMKALATHGCYPFDAAREGLVLAEGATILVLEAADAWKQRESTQVYGSVLGGGLRADAHHVSAPDPNQQGSQLALEACLKHSDLTPADVGYVHAHGTGTQLNDIHEAKLVARRLPHLPAISSTKGATGHPLGASGALGAAFSLLALRHQMLPPNVGLQTSPIYPHVIAQATPHRFHTALCFSFGFGGQNAVLALGRWP
jgi:3-oxoacyl-[acyl-carrier-protein] synthase II